MRRPITSFFYFLSSKQLQFTLPCSHWSPKPRFSKNNRLPGLVLRAEGEGRSVGGGSFFHILQLGGLFCFHYSFNLAVGSEQESEVEYDSVLLDNVYDNLCCYTHVSSHSTHTHFNQPTTNVIHRQCVVF